MRLMRISAESPLYAASWGDSLVRPKWLGRVALGWDVKPLGGAANAVGGAVTRACSSTGPCRVCRALPGILLTVALPDGS
jgi:hypothetical protein